MATIQDVSPTRASTSLPTQRFVTGRMLSLDSSDDGKLIVAGSLSSNLWVSEDGGQSWSQLQWSQPDDGQFGVPGAIGGFCVPSVAVGPDSARWLVDRNPRFLADLTGNGLADIVGFGDAGVYVALGNGDGTFTYNPQPVIQDFGYDAGWRIDKHPRFLADLTGNGCADIIGFGDAGVYVALSNGDGTFTYDPVPVIEDFGYVAGGWRVDKHPRFLAPLTSHGWSDIVGFGDAGVYVALSNGDGTFSYQPQPVIEDFGYVAGGWRVDEHPRFLARLTHHHRCDIVGFGDAGVYVALSNGDGTFAVPQFVLPQFGFEITVLAMVQSDRQSLDAGVWRSTDRGQTWALAHMFPRNPGAARLPAAGQLVWAPGTANLVYAAGGSSLAISTDGGATFTDVMPQRLGGFQAVNHVAVAPALPGDLQPPVVYALASSLIFVSFDAGLTWTKDEGTVPPNAGDPVGLSNSQNECVMVVSPRSPFEVFLTADANQTPPAIYRGDYSQFSQTSQSSWQSLPLPTLGQQYSGNVFVAATRPGQGEVLFYGPQRSKVFAASLDPASASDWVELDNGQHVHVDLHGIFLSRDFAASFSGRQYQPSAGTAWIAADGGIFRSTDGGMDFRPVGDINTLSCVNIAGVALPGHGPVISLNTGDNDGYASTDGGQSWVPQDYGGGDNDCSFADPLRPQSMLLFTPRWDQTATSVGAGVGQTLALYEAVVGELPDISSPDMRHMVIGPSLRAGSTLWNASSGYGLRGSRPIVPNVPGDDASEPGDYVFIRFFGNYNTSQLQRPNNLAVLLRTQRLRDIHARTDWDTPGGWRVDKHPRLLADLTTDGRADIVGFGDAGVWTALSNPDGTFADPHFVLADLGYDSGWRVDKHPRLLAPMSHNGWSDVVGFGDAGVYVAFGNGDGTFTFDAVPKIPDFGYVAGGWRVDKHPRFLAPLTSHGWSDIVGFGDAGVYVALNNGDGTFTYNPQPVIQDFGYDAGWRVDKHPRFLADLTGNGCSDIIGFGDAGVYVALSNGYGTFSYYPQPVIEALGYVAGGWRVDRHPRLLAPLTSNGWSDIVGFGEAGVVVALGDGQGGFSYNPQPVITDFGYAAGGWRVDKHPRFLAAVTSNGWSDVVGFGDAGVLMAPSNGDGTFTQPALFVIPNFGYRDDGPVQQQGPFLPDPNIGLVQATGGHSATVFYVGGDPASQLWKWTDGMTSWQRLVPGGGAGQARRFFVNPYVPSMIYLLDADHILRSDDGGASWQVDACLEQQLTCGGLIPADRGEDDDGQGDHLDVILTDMQFDPFNPGRRFAVGLGGAFATVDGTTWTRLLDTGALRGRPANCYFDWVSQPSDPALYVSFAGRSIVKISGLPSLDTRPLNVRTKDGQLGRTRAMPDNRLLVELTDGRSFVIDAERLEPQGDATYLIT